MMGDVSLVGALQALAAQAAIFQALLLGASAVHKAVRWTHSLTVAEQFAAVPRLAAAAVLSAVTAGELTAGALLIVPAHRSSGAMLSAGIWTLYLALIVRAIVQGRRDVDCGCSFGSTTRPLGSFHVARNAVLVSLSLGIAWVSAQGGSVAAQGSQVLGGIALLALYGALDQVMALQPLRGGELL